MHTYALSHLSDAALLRDLAALLTKDRLTTAAVLAHIAEVDARKLYVPEGYSSMHEFCVAALRLSEDAAFKRIRAARAARQFPAIFDAVAEGRLHVTGICLLAPHLSPENADELLPAAEGRRKSEIEEMLAERFSRCATSSVVRACQVVSGRVDTCDMQLVPEPVVVSRESDGNLTSIADAEGEAAVPAGPSVRYLLRLSLEKSTHEKLRYAQALLSHSVPSEDVAQLLDRALDALITQLEKRKFGGVVRPAPSRGPRRVRRDTSATSEPNVPDRYIPAHVRRAVWERDQGRCTFVSASGRRCDAHRFLEFDHVDPVARGGQATIEGMRLRCRAHNQYEAERAFGKGFMDEKRREARLARARMLAPGEGDREARDRAIRERTRDVVSALRTLGCRADDARRAADFSRTLHGATLEDSLRAALIFLGRKAAPPRATSDPRPAGVR